MATFSEWNGVHWNGVSSPENFGGPCIKDMDDGTGRAIYGTAPVTIGPGQRVRVMRWDGHEFETLGGEFIRANGQAHIWSLSMFSPSPTQPPHLFAAGEFSSVDGVAASNIAEWDGNAWAAIGSGVNGPINSLEVFDDGSGPALYVAGDFTVAGGILANSIARWDGSSWSTLANGFDGGSDPGSNRTVHELAVFDDGAGGGPALYAIGAFEVVNGIDSCQIARWGRFAPPQPGDATGDCLVNVNDLLAVITNWSASGSQGDLNHDGVVDVNDLLLVVLNWG